jgi:hypothetical protein
VRLRYQQQGIHPLQHAAPATQQALAAQAAVDATNAAVAAAVFLTMVFMVFPRLMLMAKWLQCDTKAYVWSAP